MAKPIVVYLELGSKRVFACAIDWPGWARSAKTEDAALEALASYAPRYRVVPEEARVAFASGPFEVVERVPGDGTTDFGAPGAIPAIDTATPLRAKEAERLASLVEASWTVFDRVVAGAPPTLRKGPRGGGRDRDPIVAHVADAEAAYARRIGLGKGDTSRDDILGALRAGPAAGAKWPPRYGARRIAWHALDHAWEIEDKSD
ncbi:MAG TPA: hypothetical protein VFA94_14905 [Acidimicrobiales bacterium]|nr:hypothetical protein [Acidimicrobiales bacterium]